MTRNPATRSATPRQHSSVLRQIRCCCVQELPLRHRLQLPKRRGEQHNRAPSDMRGRARCRHRRRCTRNRRLPPPAKPCCNPQPARAAKTHARRPTPRSFQPGSARRSARCDGRAARRQSAPAAPCGKPDPAAPRSAASRIPGMSCAASAKAAIATCCSFGRVNEATIATVKAASALQAGEVAALMMSSRSPLAMTTMRSHESRIAPPRIAPPAAKPRAPDPSRRGHGQFARGRLIHPKVAIVHRVDGRDRLLLRPACREAAMVVIDHLDRFVAQKVFERALVAAERQGQDRRVCERRLPEAAHRRRWRQIRSGHWPRGCGEVDDDVFEPPGRPAIDQEEDPSGPKRVIDPGGRAAYRCRHRRGHLVGEGLDEGVLHGWCRLAVPGEDPLVLRPILPPQQGGGQLRAAQQNVGLAQAPPDRSRAPARRYRRLRPLRRRGGITLDKAAVGDGAATLQERGMELADRPQRSRSLPALRRPAMSRSASGRLRAIRRCCRRAANPRPAPSACRACTRYL